MSSGSPRAALLMRAVGQLSYEETAAALALVRFYADTLEIFLVRLGVAAIAWALFGVLLLRERRLALRATTPQRER